jgi:hypothetical protein
MFPLGEGMAVLAERGSVFDDVAAIRHVVPVDDMVRVECIGSRLDSAAKAPMPVALKDLMTEPLSDLPLLAAHAIQ